MNLNFGAIIKVTGMLCIILGIAMMPSLIIALCCSEWQSVAAFALTAILTILSGSILYFRTKHIDRNLKMRDGFLIVSLTWIMAGILGALPFVISGSITNFIDAFFESCSGFSTTGATILTDIESLPKSILFWRSFTHWLGGMGIVLFAIAILPALGLNGQTIARAEIPGPVLEKISAKMNDTAKAVYTTYGLFTAVEIILLCIGGMSLFDAAVHTFGSVGTGGFSNYNNSIAYFDSTYINIVITAFMLLSGISFNLYSAALRRGVKVITKDSEFRLYLLFIGIAVALIAFNLYFEGIYSGGKSIEQSAFHTVSIMTTTGFATTDYTLWPVFSQMVLFLLFFIGACSGSTGGGIKVMRILVLLKYIRRGIHIRLHPKEIIDVKLNGEHVHSQTVTAIVTHLFLFITVALAGSVLVSIDNHDIVTNISAVLSSIGNIGPGFELVNPMDNYSIFSGFSKLVLSILMIAGRLELVTLLVIFTPNFWNPNK